MCSILEEERKAGMREGMRKGKATGKLEGLLAAAKRMVESGIASLDQIVETLKLDEAQIKALRAML